MKICPRSGSIDQKPIFIHGGVRQTGMADSELIEESGAAAGRVSLHREGVRGNEYVSSPVRIADNQVGGLGTESDESAILA